MKKWIFFLALPFSLGAYTQGYETERLALDIQKLAGLKNMLSELDKAYEILDRGYGAIKEASAADFNLHKSFLEGLLAVSPAVRNYGHVRDILRDQLSIVSGYQSAISRFGRDPHFSPAEGNYLRTVYQNLASGSLSNVKNLLNLLEDGVFRMNDGERLHAIDEIYSDTREKLAFLKDFNNKAGLLSLQRGAEINDRQTLLNLYRQGIK